MTEHSAAGAPGRDVDDALMYAITGETVPAAVAGSPAFTQEQRSAERTVASLRRGMDTLADELATAARRAAAVPVTARPDDGPAAVRERRHGARRGFSWPWGTRRTVAVAGGLAGVAIATTVAVVAVSTTRQPDLPGSVSRSQPGVVACAETIAIGSVTELRQQDDRTMVSLTAERILKPSEPPGAFTVAVSTLGDTAPTRSLQVGERVLVVVHDAASGDVDVWTGADIATEWAWMERALPASVDVDTSQC